MGSGTMFTLEMLGGLLPLENGGFVANIAARMVGIDKAMEKQKQVKSLYRARRNPCRRAYDKVYPETFGHGGTGSRGTRQRKETRQLQIDWSE
jgi:hypothetical protein